MSFLVALLLVGLVFAVSHLGWGPGIHIQLSSRLLKENPGRIPAEKRRLLEQYPADFQYGCIAADIINFKAYGGLKNHCHNWNIKERFEEVVDAEHENAFLFGYLCHLAADIIAHNHFIPYHLLYDLPPTLLGHTYWEARLDSRVEDHHWEVIDSLRTAPELHESDRIINTAVKRKALSLSSNKWIFNNILLARSRRSWREIMNQMQNRKPRGELQDGFTERCLDRCLENMYRVFDNDALAQLRKRDPTGVASIREARRQRRALIDKYGSRSAGAAAARALAERIFAV